MPIPRNLEKAVPKLLDRLDQAKKNLKFNEAEGEDSDSALVDGLIEKIEKELKDMKDLFPRVKPWEQKLLHHFTISEHLLHSFILQAQIDASNVNPMPMLEEILAEINRIKASVPLVDQMPQITSSEDSTKHRSEIEDEDANMAEPKHSKDWLDLQVEEHIIADPAMKDLQVSYEFLRNHRLRLCLLYFSIFPENAVVKKRPLIYWWIGEGLITKTNQKTAEEVGEAIFEMFLELDLIKPCGDDKSSPIVNECQLHPWMRYMLISLAKTANLFAFDSRGTPSLDSSVVDSTADNADSNAGNVHLNTHRHAFLVLNPNLMGSNGLQYENMLAKKNKYENLWTVFNINQRCISFDPEWLSRLKKLVVLQLGRWQGSSKHHIEVLNEEILKGLGTQKHLKYLSFRGISRITAIPKSILDLINLEILDLRACHSLEKLPSDIASLRKLTHLDVSECYLLVSMPKGIEKLSSLQVLKGFVIGNTKKTPCRLGNLKDLKTLKRLSIHIGTEAVIQDGEFDELQEILSLRCLKISWGKKVVLRSISFPAGLQKLDLEGIPDETPKWLTPNELLNLKKLYIKGGQLKSLDAGRWRVEILRLMYLKNLKSLQYLNNLKHMKEVDRSDLLNQFPDIMYLEIIKCNMIKEGRELVWIKGELSEEII
ncbi:Disease resistance RPP13-like protein 4 [Quillaja saponaria]|uniref:Disease resistance RPP13-like protein 4 n=1 Tax=Quillaja saponaria TaxID=32244 RepID=A0AAD7VFD5_QUISA|nr:Disease resistance RPP13-like protein 4 [Quillaja saponaria]